MTQTIIKVPAVGGGSFDPTDITITDNTSGAWLIKDDSGSPTEYMRIDTTSGAELTKFVVHDDGANQNKFVVSTDRSNSDLIQITPRNVGLGNTEGVFFSGNSTTQVWVNGPSVFRVQNASLLHNMTGSQNASTYLGTAADWIVTRGSPSEQMIKFEHDSNMTFTLDNSAGGVFKAQDNAGTPNEFLKIDSDTSASLIEFNVPSGQGAGMTVNLPADSGSNTGFQCTVPGGAGHLKFGRQASGIYTGGTAFQASAGNCNLSVQGNQFMLQSSSPDITVNLNASTVDFKVTDAGDADILKIEENSSLTHTLDDGSGATFKVVDSNASPKTYLSITESTQSFGADPYVHKVTLGDNNGYFSLGNNTLRANAMSGGATGLYGPASYLYVQNRVGVTTNQTYGDFDPCQTPYTITMGAGATSDVTIDSGFTVRGDYQTSSNPVQSYPVLWVFQNDNATHNFILSFDAGVTGLEHTKPGDTDAAALISSGGLTLTPGQRYIVRFQKIVNELLLIESVDKH